MNGLAGNVLVTGSTGFIGSHLVHRLAAMPGTRVFALSRGALASSDDVIRVRAPLQDLTPDTWCSAGIETLDYVFHLGAFTPKSAGDESLDDIYRSNVEGTRLLLESLPGVRRRIVFASTLDVYLPSGSGESIDEESATRPRGLYAASKLFGEYQVRNYALRAGCEHAILRYGHIFGPGEERYAKLIPTVIRTLLNGETPVLYGDGSPQRDLLYVSDAVEATVRAATANAELADPLNIVRGTSVPIRTVVELLMGITETAGPPNEIPAPPGHSLRFDSHRMRSALGSWDLVSLEDGLRREVAHFRALAE